MVFPPTVTATVLGKLAEHKAGFRYVIEFDLDSSWPLLNFVVLHVFVGLVVMQRQHVLLVQRAVQLI